MNEKRHECIHLYIYTDLKVRVLVGLLDPPNNFFHAWDTNKMEWH